MLSQVATVNLFFPIASLAVCFQIGVFGVNVELNPTLGDRSVQLTWLMLSPVEIKPFVVIAEKLVAKVFNNFYGTTRTPVIDKLDRGKNVLFDIDWQGADQIKNKRLDYKLITFFILPPSKEVLFQRLSNRDMKDKLIVEERMRQFGRDVLHWINYDYVVINENLESCYSKIYNLIQAEINNGSKDYDPDFIREHVEKLTS